MLNALVSLYQKLHYVLFDFSANDNNRREIEDILIAALAESKNDFDFSNTLRRVIIRYEGSVEEGEPRYIAFHRFMWMNQRPGEQLASYRVRAEHLLEDLPHIFGDKKKRLLPMPFAPLSQSHEGTQNAVETAVDGRGEKSADV